MGNHGRFDQTTGQRTVITPPAPAGATLRYNWVAPIVLSPHNPQILYAGSQFLHRSLNRGDAWETISPDLTVNEPGKAGRNSGSVPYATITTISESPARAGLIWVGSDDGKVQVTQNHGASWTDATPALVAAGAPVDWAVSRVFASPHDATTAFVSKSGFRHDDFRPQLFRTTDAGKTWTRISGNLPPGPINVVVQDRKNRNLLIVGTDLAVHVSIDGGASWARLKANLPTVAVHDLTIHPRENDLVLGHLRARDLGRRHHAAAGPDARDARQSRASLRRRAARPLRVQRDRQLRPARSQLSRRAERARRDRHQLLREGREQHRRARDRRRPGRPRRRDADGAGERRPESRAVGARGRRRWSCGWRTSGRWRSRRRRWPGRRRRVRRDARGRGRKAEQAGESSRADQVSEAQPPSGDRAAPQRGTAAVVEALSVDRPLDLY